MSFLAAVIFCQSMFSPIPDQVHLMPPFEAHQVARNSSFTLRMPEIAPRIDRDMLSRIMKIRRIDGNFVLWSGHHLTFGVRSRADSGIGPQIGGPIPIRFLGKSRLSWSAWFPFSSEEDNPLELSSAVVGFTVKF